MQIFARHFHLWHLLTAKCRQNRSFDRGSETGSGVPSRTGLYPRSVWKIALVPETTSVIIPLIASLWRNDLASESFHWSSVEALFAAQLIFRFRFDETDCLMNTSHGVSMRAQLAPQSQSLCARLS